MKKSILSLSAAVALGGLGFAGSAGAIAILNPVGSAADQLVLNPNGTGHMLFVPYYTAQGSEATFINIVNTDTQNGKAVKVRFRSASNSDDVLDFHLYLSPGDVWSGMVSQNPDTGNAQIYTQDKSCTYPFQSQKGPDGWPAQFRGADRLPSYVTEAARAALSREGYVEILNMADVPKNTAKDSLYTAIKHVAGVAPCDSSAFDWETLVTDTTYVTPVTSTTDPSGYKNTMGLSNPTGGLMGSWLILNQADTTAFSGESTSIIATDTTTYPISTGGQVTTLPANFAFAPQIGIAIDNASISDANTADPLLKSRTAEAYAINPLWWDLPDMSTPLVIATHTAPGTNSVTAETQAARLSASLSKFQIVNEYVATGAGAPVPFATDWIIAQPTRRYHAAVGYTDKASTARIVWSDTATAGTTTRPTLAIDNTATPPVWAGNIYANLTLQSITSPSGLDLGMQACYGFKFGAYDREEGMLQSNLTGGFSPGSAPSAKTFCGEVMALQLGTSSTLGADITAASVNTLLPSTAGWAQVNAGTLVDKTVDPAVTYYYNLPIAGFAAIKFTNMLTNVNYGQTMVHRMMAAQPQ